MPTRLFDVRNNLFLIFFLLLTLALYPQANSPRTIENPSTKKQFTELYKTGEGFRLSGDYEEAIKQFERALSLAQRSNDEEGELDSLLKLGTLYWNIGKIKESFDMCRLSLAIAEKMQMKEKVNDCLAILEIYDNYSKAKDYLSKGSYKESNASFNSAINIAKRIGSKEHELKCLRQLSLNYWDLNNFQAFFSLTKEALLIARELKHKKEEGRCLNNIGLYYWQFDNYSEALKNYEKSLAIAASIKDAVGEANGLNNIGALYIDLGNYDQALGYLIRALGLDRVLKEQSNISQDLNNIGSVFRRKAIISENRDDFLAALEYYKESLSIAKKIDDKITVIKVLNNMGTIYSYLKQNARALSFLRLAFRKAQEMQNKEEMSIILNNMGIIYSQIGNLKESARYYQKAINLALETKEGKILWEPYMEKANAHKNQDDFDAALDNYKKSISVIENIRSGINLEELKATYFGTDRKIEAYQGIIDLLVKLFQKTAEKSYAAQAFDYLERAKARAFLDSMEVSKINLTEGISQKLLNQETELMNEISKCYTKLLTPQLSLEQRNNISKELLNYEDQLDSLKREIRAASPAYANLRYPKSITLAEAQSRLINEETAFFAYTIGKENSYAFVITKKELKIFPLPGRTEIQKLVREYLAAITDVQNRDFHLGYSLYDALVRPGLNETKIKNIILIPDDVLYFLPFETLITKKDTREWLIKSYNVAYVPSLSSLRELIDRKKAVPRKPKKDILAIGDPSFGANEIVLADKSKSNLFQDYSSNAEYKFSRLKYSGLEIEKIASLFKPRKSDILEREQASEENIKQKNLSNYKIVHFATHAIIDDKKPARSAIVLTLAQDQKEDGFLQMREVFNLKLNADLVTLSACQTGLGQLIRGEGIEGLNRAFFFAGASSVMLSLWAINDQASCQLLERFYVHLRSSEPIMNALRRAKLEMIGSEMLAHPYYWGGFIVTGETDKLIFPRGMNKWFLITASLCAGLALLILIINREKPSLFSVKN